MNGMEQQIQAAAEKLFLHYGFRKTSVDQIARKQVLVRERFITTSVTRKSYLGVARGIGET